MPPVDDRHAELLPAKLTRAAQKTLWVLIVLDGKADPGNVSERFPGSFLSYRNFPEFSIWLRMKSA